MKILFIGTSHIGALKDAWDRYGYASLHQGDFIASTGPGFIKSLDAAAWKFEGRSLLVPGPKPYLVSCSENVGGSVDLSIYDRVVFSDLAFAYVVSKRFRGRPNSFLLDGRPISEPLMSELRITGLGYRKLKDDPRFGSTRLVDTVAFMAQVATLASQAEVYLVPSPMPVASVSDTQAANDVIASARKYEEVARQRLAGSRIILAVRPQASIAETGATKPHLSIGESRKRPGEMDPHMNAEYGQMQIDELLAA